MQGRRISSVVVLTALGLEREAMLEHLDLQGELQHPAGTIYDVGVLRCAGDLQVAVAEVGAGNVASAFHVERAAAFLEPDLIVFLGVAGGVKDVRHGDVVVASKVYGYEAGKAESEFRTRPDAYPLSHRIEQQARRVIASEDWLARLPATGEGADSPRALLGPLAAGEAVLRSTDSELFARLRENFGDTLAVEMEGSGFFAAAFANDSLPAVVIRGISDLIDDKDEANDRVWQPQAARNAAALTVELLHRLCGEVAPLALGSADAMSAITTNLSDAYYLNVPRLLADPSALAFLTSEEAEALRGVGAWADLGMTDGLRLRHLCEREIEHWTGTALPLAEALGSAEVGSRVVFDGPFRTRNWKKFDPEVGLTGDLDVDPLVYVDVDGRRVFMPIEPRWATSSTAQVVFNEGSVSLSGVALLRDVAEQTALASPFVLAPPVSGRALDALLFGGS